MIEFIRPVRYGVLLGLAGIVFGIVWAFYLTLGHDRIHETLQKRMPRTFQIVPESMHGEGIDHKKEEGAFKISPAGEHKEHFKGGYDNPLMELSHRRLTRGHIHAMGLGIVTIIVSLVLASTSAKEMIKKMASTLSGIGGIVYPVAWIIMGYKTPSLGPEGAEASVTTIAGPAVAFLTLGIFTAIAFLLKDLFTRK